MAVTADKIRKLKYFTGIEDDRLVSILPFVKNKSYFKGETIVAEGDTEPKLQFVETGAVKVFKTSSEGKEQIIEIVRPGQSFGELNLFSPAPSPYSAQAMGITTDILWVHRDDLIAFMEKNWKATLNALAVISGQARSLLLLVEDLSFKNVTGRVAKILLQHSVPAPEGFPRKWLEDR
jgi:CRP-like cAMP-binding protein